MCETSENKHNPEALPEIQQHPKFQDICQCHCASYQTRIQTFLVYMDLAESKGWWNLRIEDNVKLGCVMISGHRSQTALRDYVLPLDSKSSLTHAQIQNITHTAHEDYNTESVILAIIDDNSSIVYYQVSAALCPPNPVESVELKKAKSHRMFERRKTKLQQLQEEVKQTKSEKIQKQTETKQSLSSDSSV